MDRLRRAFVVAAAGWAVSLPLATFAASRVHVNGAVAAASVVVYAVGAIVCHQLPVRSFHVWGVQMPVCARCLGIYFGAAVGCVVIARLKPRATPDAPLTPRVPGVVVARGFSRAKVVAAIAVAPTAVTLIYEWTTGIMPSNPVRFAAGLWLGALLATMVVTATAAPLPEVN